MDRPPEEALYECGAEEAGERDVRLAEWYRRLRATTNDAFFPLYRDEHRFLVLKGGGQERLCRAEARREGSLRAGSQVPCVQEGWQDAPRELLPPDSRNGGRVLSGYRLRQERHRDERDLPERE